MNQLLTSSLAVGTVTASLLTVFPASAAIFTATGTNSITGSSLAAQANFAVSGSNLQITFTNTGGTTFAQSDILTAIFFDITGSSPSLSLTSASAAGGSQQLQNGSTSAAPADLRSPSNPSGGTLAGGWQFKSQSGGLGSGVTQQYGIGTAGFGIFNGNPTTGVGNFNYGLISNAGYASPNNGQVPPEPMIQNALLFSLSGVGSGFDPSRIANVRFQYGTALNEPSLTPPGNTIPTPALLPGLIGMGLGVLRKKRQIQQNEQEAVVD